MRGQSLTASLLSCLALGTLPARVLGEQILQTSSFTTCVANSNVTVTRMDISYNNDNQTVTFDVAGSSSKAMNVTAVLNVLAYGNSVYSNSFNPCDPGTFVQQLCPVPAGTFAASGTQAIPAQYASLVPAIAFQIPDISAQATLQLKSLDTGNDVACIQSEVTNGKTVSVPAVSYVAASVAGAAFVLTGVSSIVGVMSAGTVAAPGAGTMAPGFVQVVGWFQGMAMNGMMSASLPPVYRSFAKNFAFSAGLIQWTAMQQSIDSFREKTGGNTSTDSVQFLQNATLVFGDGSAANTTSKVRRAISLYMRDITTSVNTTVDTAPTNSSALSLFEDRVNGIAAYVEDLSIPKTNTFMTILLILAIIIAAIAVAVLFFKLILEFWALFGSFPKSLTGFRKHYWGTMARSIVQLILMAYGVLALYSIFEFTHGDSWAAKALAGAVLGIFTGVLAFFTFKISRLASKSKEMEGDASLLYEDKETWTKYSLFYDSYKKDFWWTFLPAIVYMFTKGCVMAATDGHAMVQTISQIVIEAVMLIFLIFVRPYERKSGNVISIFIQVVRAMSVVCILVFVEELGISQTTQTVTGVVLIAIQSVLTAALAILIIANAIIICCKANPHRKRRKEAEKMNRDLDNLTPLHAHNSLLIGHGKSNSLTNVTTDSSVEPKLPPLTLSPTKSSSFSFSTLTNTAGNGGGNSFSTPSQLESGMRMEMKPSGIGGPYGPANSYRNVMGSRDKPGPRPYRPESRERLVQAAAPIGGRSGSSAGRDPGYRGMAY